MQSYITTAIIGGIGGYLAGFILRGRGFGLITNIIIGIIGSFIGSYILGIIGILGTGFLFRIFSSFVGAIVFVIAIKFLHSFIS